MQRAYAYGQVKPLLDQIDCTVAKRQIDAQLRIQTRQIQQYWRHAQLPAFSALRVRGLMTLALFSSEAGRVRECFVRLRTLRDRLRQEAPAGIALVELWLAAAGAGRHGADRHCPVCRAGQRPGARAAGVLLGAGALGLRCG